MHRGVTGEVCAQRLCVGPRSLGSAHTTHRFVPCLRAVSQAEFDHAVPVQFVEELELAGQLVGLLPLCAEFGPFLVVVMIRQILARVGVPAEGPETVQMDLITHGGRQRVHDNSGAETFGRKVFSLPVSAKKNKKTPTTWTLMSPLPPLAVCITTDVIHELTW